MGIFHKLYFSLWELLYTLFTWNRFYKAHMHFFRRARVSSLEIGAYGASNLNPFTDLKFKLQFHSDKNKNQFYSFLIVNAVLNAFFSFTSRNFEHFYVIRKASSFSKTLKNVAAESCCFWSWCWVIVTTQFYVAELAKALQWAKHIRWFCVHWAPYY